MFSFTRSERRDKTSRAARGFHLKKRCSRLLLGNCSFVLFCHNMFFYFAAAVFLSKKLFSGIVPLTRSFCLKRPDRDTFTSLRNVCSLMTVSSWESSNASSPIVLMFLLSVLLCFADFLSGFANSCWTSFRIFLFFPVKVFHQGNLSAIMSC